MAGMMVEFVLCFVLVLGFVLKIQKRKFLKIRFSQNNNAKVFFPRSLETVNYRFSSILSPTNYTKEVRLESKCTQQNNSR